MFITRNCSTFDYDMKSRDLTTKDLIFNYSKEILSEEEIEALSHGLKFGLHLKSINYSRRFVSFDKLFNLVQLGKNFNL